MEISVIDNFLISGLFPQLVSLIDKCVPNANHKQSVYNYITDHLMEQRKYSIVFSLMNKFILLRILHNEEYYSILSRVINLDMFSQLCSNDDIIDTINCKHLMSISSIRYDINSFRYTTSIDIFVNCKYYVPLIRADYDFSLVNERCIDYCVVNKIDITNPEFKTMCLKYGTEDIYKKIVEAVQ